ncbi:hypothetical protein ES703_30029 [subsurface metagenome]
MPYLVSTACWPSDKGDEVVKKAIEVIQKYPPDLSLGEPVVPNAIKASPEGMRAMSITEVKEGKLEAALKRATDVFVMYQPIAGFEWSVDIWFTVAEAYTAIGKTPPG